MAVLLDGSGRAQQTDATEALNDVADYIVSLYNSQRLHSKLGNLPPNAVEQKSAIKPTIGLCEKTGPGHTAVGFLFYRQ